MLLSLTAPPARERESERKAKNYPNLFGVPGSHTPVHKTGTVLLDSDRGYKHSSDIKYD